MILITIISSILVASVSIIQFQIESQEYHQERLERKEKQIKEHIVYILSKTPHPLITQNIPSIFQSRIFEISDIHNLVINVYDLDGLLLINSNAPNAKIEKAPIIPTYILENVKLSNENRFVTLAEKEGDKYRYSYSYLMDYVENKPIGILKLPYKEDDTFYKNELENFLSVFGLVYISMIIVSVFIAYYLSRFITKSLKTISDKLTETSLTEKNEKIELTSNSYEIDRLVKSYNKMIDELEESANKLAQSEREEAWREMAKQVAHEIKNPLTPMRLTVQSFQRKFDVNDPLVNQKLDDYSKTLIQQIDTMSAVASAFSNFASMPAQQNETLNVVDIVELTLDIFNEEFIQFESDSEEIITKIDKTQLIRIVNNLVKNAIQAISEEQENKQIIVTVKKESNNAIIKVKDNGKGILKEDFERIFEPKFTTKSSGMGLGLAIIKNIIENYNGTITFESQLGKGTTFKVTLPIIKQ
ncbi:HAMP domain-containing sensor histidine kinase [Flavobacterium sp.]|uniref:sensor histidine kinase n=1 Tax=Flavobacterium sp. TaxID=239 RepID=UPI00286EB2D2|nr:HAMP domain-containing sensor histidine kinase [Flavobacterium sp.]